MAQKTPLTKQMGKKKTDVYLQAHEIFFCIGPVDAESSFVKKTKMVPQTIGRADGFTISQ